MFDASFPSESFSNNLPPPPAPFVALGLLTPAVRNIPPTTKGHLHYGAIEYLQGVIGAIDVDKEDEEFNELQSKIAGTSIPSAVNTSSHHQQYPGKSANPTDNNNHDTINTAITPSTSTSNDRVEEEAYEILPLSNGLVCSRKASGRVLYRIAKHIESLL